MKNCKVKDCKKKFLAKGYCSKHYNQIRRNGCIFDGSRNKENPIKIKKDFALVGLFDKKHNIQSWVKIDLDFVEVIKKYKWSLTYYGYAFCQKSNVFMHQLVIGKKDGFEIDHINQNKLDNRAKNLRHVTRSQNNINSNLKRGYWYNKNRKLWEAYIKKDKRKYHLGSYNKEEEAFMGRLFGEYIYFPEIAP